MTEVARSGRKLTVRCCHVVRLDSEAFPIVAMSRACPVGAADPVGAMGRMVSKLQSGSNHCEKLSDYTTTLEEASNGMCTDPTRSNLSTVDSSWG